MKKILLLIGHPDKSSFNAALADAYQKGVETKGAEVKRIFISDLDFGKPYISNYQEKLTSVDLQKVQQLILWADHMVFIYPTWWYLPPALVKSFMEHVLQPGFAFKYKENPYRVMWDSYLKGKTASLISTMDAPPVYYRIIVGNPGGKAMKSSLEFCGIKLKKQTYYGSIKVSKPIQRAKWLQKTEQLGNQFN